MAAFWLPLESAADTETFYDGVQLGRASNEKGPSNEFGDSREMRATVPQQSSIERSSRGFVARPRLLNFENRPVIDF